MICCLLGLLPLWQGASLTTQLDEITRGLEEHPIPVLRPEGTNGLLELGWNEDLLAVLASESGVFVAASKLGRGRIVAFSGQDFLSSDQATTFLGLEGNDRLLRNAIRWSSRQAPDGKPRVLVDNEAIADRLRGGPWKEVRIAAERKHGRPQDPPAARDWSRAALADADVAVVLVNEWDSTRVAPSGIAALRAFVEDGGGLLVGGSSYHWDGDDPNEFPANLIAAGSGIRWQPDEEPDLARARIVTGRLASPVNLWQAYVRGESLSVMETAQLPQLFTAAERMGRGDEIDRALQRLLRETPELPVAATDARARLSAEVAQSLEPRPWPDAHPWAATFPGLPDAGAARIERVVEVDASSRGARPLGLYAPPGELISLEFSDAQVDRGLWIVVGDDHDDLRSLDHHEEWHRAPALRRGFPVDAPVVRVSNPYGGALYLRLPEELAPPGETFPVTVRGAIAMAVYTLDETRLGDWRRDLRLGAPQAVLQARGRMRFVVPSSAAAAIGDPRRMLEFWSGFHASHAELAQEPAPRRFESHWIFDPQVGWGYANASTVAAPSHSPWHLVERVVFPLDSVMSILRAESVDEFWTIGHELGHQFQTEDWIGGDLTEVAVNLFALYTTNGYVRGGGDFETAGFEEDHYGHADLVDFRWDEGGDWEKLQLYRQLVLEFGWEPFKATFASYHDPAYPRAEYGSHLDGFAIRFSATVQRDLTPFLAHWRYPLSEQAAARIRSFGHRPWMPPGWPASGD